MTRSNLSKQEERDPTWLDRTRYPFESHYLDLLEGQLHYVDEGEGQPVVLVHGNPTWSFLYRHLVTGLSDEYRCIAFDLLGFGLSETPADFSYQPAAHARVIERLIEALNLSDTVVVGHDWGGPLGLDYATRNPDTVAGLVMMNTWMWPRRGILSQAVSRAVGNPIGKRLVLQYNAFARTAIGLAYLAHSGVDASAYRHYMAPLATPADRMGSWVFVRELLSSHGWHARLWDRRAAIAEVPALLVWGKRDPIHRPLLPRWQAQFPTASEAIYSDIGHFVPEEVESDLVQPVREFLIEL